MTSGPWSGSPIYEEKPDRQIFDHRVRVVSRPGSISRDTRVTASAGLVDALTKVDKTDDSVTTEDTIQVSGGFRDVVPCFGEAVLNGISSFVLGSTRLEELKASFGTAQVVQTGMFRSIHLGRRQALQAPTLTTLPCRL